MVEKIILVILGILLGSSLCLRWYTPHDVITDVTYQGKSVDIKCLPVEVQSYLVSFTKTLK